MAFLFVTATFYEHCGLSVPYPLGRSYSPFPASVTFKSWLGIFERKDKWAAYANEIVMFCIFILHQLQAKVSFVSIILLIISTGVIVVLAPCNNAEIHCSSLELQSIKKSVHRRLALYSLLIAIFIVLKPILANTLIIAEFAVAVLVALSRLGVGIQ